MEKREQKPAAAAPFDHPCVWRGKELESRPDWFRELGGAEVEELVAAARKIADKPLASLSSGDISLPLLGPALTAIRENLESGCGGAFVRGFPVHDHPEEICRAAFYAVCLHIGTPVSQSAAGELIFSVRDSGFKADDPRARGPNTSKKLSFHTDRCDVIGFLCLNQALEGGENEVVSSAALFNEILQRRPDLLEVLMRRYRYHRHNVDTANPLPYCEQPIFSVYQGHFASNLLRVLIERAYSADGADPMSAEQREALDFLEEVAAEPDFHYRFRQKPGDFLFLNNWVTYHRRTAFVDHDDLQKRRHILRGWLSVPNSRPLHPDFAANYGCTEAGAIRGGMRAI